MSLRNGRSVSTNTLSLQLNDILPAGTLLDFAGTSAPSGFLLCDGSAVSRTTYTALFNNIGTTYGVGNGTTTFNLPDSRGRTHVGKDDMGGSAANRITNAGAGIVGTTLGAAGGTETHTLSSAQMPAHGHGMNGFTGSNAITNSTNICGSNSIGGVNLNITNMTVTNTGGGTAHNNTQPTLIINKIVKY